MSNVEKFQQQSNGLMTVEDVVSQIQMIQHLMKQAMKKGEHFGVIPGCGPKPTLLKPGAEKLDLMFRLAPTYQVDPIEYQNGHREYRVICTLTHIGSGYIWGQGVGSCSTLENKFRFRWDDTGREVPKEYWVDRDPDKLGGRQFAPRKVDGKWKVYQKIEHDNPADYYNTVLKMAKKRAQVDATLTATAASDIFTQDIEDLVENEVINPEKEKEQKKKPESSGNGKNKPTAKQLDDFENEMISFFGNGDLVEQFLIENTKDFNEIHSVTGITTLKWFHALRGRFKRLKEGKYGTGDPGEEQFNFQS